MMADPWLMGEPPLPRTVLLVYSFGGSLVSLGSFRSFLNPVIFVSFL